MRFIRQKARWHQRAPGLNLWLCLVGRIRLRRHPAMSQCLMALRLSGLQHPSYPAEAAIRQGS
ncbi:hypothetical protein EQG67_07805 [Kosakonia cowanii]|nr:hypothetical protein EQG67_07805 [Kosakonia cowanii]